MRGGGAIRKKAGIAFLAFLFFTLQGPFVFSQSECTVRWVDDGDTILLEDGRHVRYIGINAPEVAGEHGLGEPFGGDAHRLNRELVWRRKVRLELDAEEKDRYGRILAYVYLPDQTFVNRSILEAGYAFVLYRQPNIRHYQLLLEAQRRAMTSKKGIWGAWQEKAGTYIGNRKSLRFHTAACRVGKQIHQKNRVLFTKTWDPFWEGFSPCKECFPEPFSLAP